MVGPGLTLHCGPRACASGPSYYDSPGLSKRGPLQGGSEGQGQAEEQRIGTNTVISPTAQEQICLGGVTSQIEVSLHPRKGRINFPKMKPVSTDRALFHLSWKEFCHANKSVSCTVMDNF